jgi:DNA-binding CsgD family transcriptional regulator
MELMTPTPEAVATLKAGVDATKRELASRQSAAARSGARDAVLVVDDERRCVEASIGACLLFGASRAEVEGRRLEDLFGAAMRERIVHFWKGFAAAGGTAGPFGVSGEEGDREVSLTVMPDVVPGRHVVGIKRGLLAGGLGGSPEPGVRVPSAREREILGLLAQGETDAQIAVQLTLSPATVQTHVRNAKAKLGARTRAQAVALALSRGLIEA